ncbi:tyrosine-type recombinase/integrase [Mycoplasmatota bacterium zrk1]
MVLYPETKKIIETIPQQTIELIFHYYKSNVILQRNYLLFRLLYDTGLRISELLNLKVNNIDFDSKTIHVQKTKTRVERYVFFGEETKALLNKYLLASSLKNYILIDFVTGEMLKLDTVHSICRRLRNEPNIEKSIRPHMWRHTFATKFVKLNGNMEVLRLIMGHSSLKTTQKYLHIDKDHLHKEYFRLNT